MAEQKFNIASSNVEDFGTGLLDDFDALITAAEFMIIKGKDKIVDNEKRTPHYLGVEVTYTLDEGDEHKEKYFAGFLNSFAPSKDGRTVAGPADTTFDDYVALAEGTATITDEPESYRGPYAIGPGTQLPALSWMQLVASMEALDPSFKCGARADTIVGYRVHLNRIKPAEAVKKKSGDKDQKVYDVLCVTAIHEKPSASVKANGKAATPTVARTATKAKAAPVAESDSIDADETIEGAVLDVLSELAAEEAKTGEKKLPIQRQRINAQVLGKLPDELKSAGLSKIGNEAWMSDASRPWTCEKGKLSFGA